jgi:hypothetical protein
VPYGVRSTVVGILRVREKAKLQSMYLYFVIVPYYTVGLFIFIIISFFSKICNSFCVQNFSHLSAVQVLSLVP